MSPSYPITASPTSSSSLMPDPQPPARPTHLQPPATIISPPSPTDVKSSHSSSFSTPPRPQSAQNSDSDVEYDSPDSGVPSSASPFSPEARPRAASNHLGPIPLVATQYSSTPVLLHPDSPAASPRPRSPVSTRSPSPSSPQYRPRRLANRRESSTHRVRETMDGEQRNTQDGGRMVNQYKIGEALGRGAYAKVELGVDVGTGTEYVNSSLRRPSLCPADGQPGGQGV